MDVLKSGGEARVHNIGDSLVPGHLPPLPLDACKHRRTLCLDDLLPSVLDAVLGELVPKDDCLNGEQGAVIELDERLAMDTPETPCECACLPELEACIGDTSEEPKVQIDTKTHAACETSEPGIGDGDAVDSHLSPRAGKEKSEEGPTCHMLHRLELMRASCLYECDYCQRDFTVDSVLHECNRCDWSVCSSCFVSAFGRRASAETGLKGGVSFAFSEHLGCSASQLGHGETSSPAHSGNSAVGKGATAKQLRKIVKKICDKGECMRIREVIAKVEEQIGKMGKDHTDLCTRILIDVMQVRFAEMSDN